MTTTDQTSGLSRENIRAIRHADSVVLRWTQDEDKRWHHTGHLDLTKKVDDGTGFKHNIHVQIPTEVMVNSYSSSPHRLAPAIRGDWVILYIKHHPEWQTFAQLLKAGDRLVQEWVVDNRNTCLKEARLTQHEVKLRVFRPTKDGQAKVFTFLLDTCVIQTHSLSGTIQRDPNWRAEA